MRKRYLIILKNFFHDALARCKHRQEATQAQMARILEMDQRSYVDLDHGISCCSGLTLARFLIYCCDDPLLFLEDLRTEFERAEQDET